MSKKIKENATVPENIKESKKIKKTALEEINDILRSYKVPEMATPTEEDFNVPRIPSGYEEIDEITMGGFPIGCICVIWGPEKSGKSSLAIKAMAEAQAMGKKGFYYDLERGVNKNFATSLGLNLTDGSVIVKPQTEKDVAETVVDVITDVIKKTDIDFIVLDSVTALLPAAEQEGSADDSNVGLQARIVNIALRKWVGMVGERNKTLIIISQEREVIGGRAQVGAPPPVMMTGGKSLKFYNSLTLYVKPKFYTKTDKPNLYQGDRKVGHMLKVVVQKSRVCPPFGETEIEFLYNPLRKILGILKSNYGESSLIKRNKANHAKFEYTDIEGKLYKGFLSTKQDWQSLLLWFKEQNLLFDLLEQAKEDSPEFIKKLYVDKDINESEYNSWCLDNEIDPNIIDIEKEADELISGPEDITTE